MFPDGSVRENEIRTVLLQYVLFNENLIRTVLLQYHYSIPSARWIEVLEHGGGHGV